MVRGAREKTDHIFVGRDGRTLQPGSINRIFDRVSKSCGIKITPHLGRVCRSLHACLFCENCWIFAEDLPATIQYRDRLLSEKKEMTDETWETLHGAALRAIDHSILPAFPTEIVKQAELRAGQNSELAPSNTMEGS